MEENRKTAHTVWPRISARHCFLVVPMNFRPLKVLHNILQFVFTSTSDSFRFLKLVTSRITAARVEFFTKVYTLMSITIFWWSALKLYNHCCNGLVSWFRYVSIYTLNESGKNEISTGRKTNFIKRCRRSVDRFLCTSSRYCSLLL